MIGTALVPRAGGGGIMNGGQDLGGMMGFGPVRPEPEPKDGGRLFHEPWEQSAFAVTLAAGGLGLWNIDQSRQMRESLHPADYLRSSYYEIWIKGLERLLLERGLVTPGELPAAAPAAPVPVKPLQAARCGRRWLAAPRTTGRCRRRRASRSATPCAPATSIRSDIPACRATPADKVGVIERCHGVFVFADSNAAGPGESPQWLYTVRFNGRDLWGDGGDPLLAVSVDAWESVSCPGLRRPGRNCGVHPDAPVEEPVFREPWEAQAFSMAVALHERGLFTWKQWADTLAAVIADPQSSTLPYYEQWLAALERLVTERDLVDGTELAKRREAWRAAARATPHGQPIVLPKD